MSHILGNSIEISRIVFDEETIRKRVIELGQMITKDFYGQEVVLIGVLKGSLYFFSDLSRSIDLPLK
ncbi:MAG: hypothetical protein WCQ74_05680, partial [Saccharofermentanales bacterium]